MGIKHAIESISEMMGRELKLDSASAKAILQCDKLLDAHASDGLSEFLKSFTLPTQTFEGNSFSQYPLTLIQKNDFCLDLYHWSGAHSSIHDHNFEGAFKIMKGTYRQKLYTFDQHEQLTSDLALGELVLVSDTILKEGEVVEIKRGATFIHSTEHGQELCVTACLRSSRPQGELNSYILPGIKLAHIALNTNQKKLLDYLGYLGQSMGSGKHEIGQIMAQLEDTLLLRVLFSVNVPATVVSADFRKMSLETLKSKHGEGKLIAAVKAALMQEKLSYLSS